MPKTSDNTLGAPTEGLGQNVTFAPADLARPPQLDAGGTTLLQAQASGGYAGVNAGGGIPAVRTDNTLALLLKAADNQIRPKLEQMRTEKYFEGMQSAMQGKAIQDIASEQPWYSRVFGPADAVEGARAYYGNTRAQEAVADMEDRMPELRKMEPAAARKFFVESVNSRLTGDKAADVSILQAMTRALPSVMRRQAKEHYGYTQENAATAQSASFLSGAEGLQRRAQAMADHGFVTPEEFALDVNQFVKDSVPVAGQDLEYWTKARTADMVGLAEQGKLHAINALRTPDAEGVSLLSVLPVEARNKIELAVNRAEGRLKTQYSFDWADQITDLRHRSSFGLGPENTPKALMAEALAMNEKYQKKTGSTVGILSPAEVESIGTHSANSIALAKIKEFDKAEALRGKAVTEGEKAAAAEAKVQTIRGSAGEGSLYILASTPGYSNDVIDSEVMKAIRSRPAAEQAAVAQQVMKENYFNGTYIVKPLAEENDGGVLRAVTTIGKDGYSPALQQEHAKWAQLNAVSPDLAAAYYPKTGARLARFDRVVTGAGIEPSSPQALAEFNNFNPKGIGDKRLTELSAKVTELNSTKWLPTWLGGQKIKPESAQQIARLAARHVDDWVEATGSEELGFQRAIKQVMSQGLVEVHGGYAIQKEPGMADLGAYLSQTSARGNIAIAADKIDDLFEQAVHQKLEGNGKTPGISLKTASHVVITRLPDLTVNSKKVPNMAIFAYDADGNQTSGSISADDIFALVAERRKKAVGPPPPTGSRPFTPAIGAVKVP